MPFFNRAAIESHEQHCGITRKKIIETAPEDMKVLVGAMSGTQAIHYARTELAFGLMEAMVFSAALSSDALIDYDDGDANADNPAMSPVF